MLNTSGPVAPAISFEAARDCTADDRTLLILDLIRLEIFDAGLDSAAFAPSAGVLTLSLGGDFKS